MDWYLDINTLSTLVSFSWFFRQWCLHTRNIRGASDIFHQSEIRMKEVRRNVKKLAKDAAQASALETQQPRLQVQLQLSGKRRHFLPKTTTSLTLRCGSVSSMDAIASKLLATLQHQILHLANPTCQSRTGSWCWATCLLQSPGSEFNDILSRSLEEAYITTREWMSWYEFSNYDERG